MIDVSIVIVSMANPKYLHGCLESVKVNTTVSYETFVVAYLMQSNLIEQLRSQYPWVTFIESNEIRGFSENNNLALREAKGRYCFVVNDDTYWSEHLIDELVHGLDALPRHVAVLSPNILKPNGDIQYCGRPKYTLFDFFLEVIGLDNKYRINSPYINQQGLFKSYNLMGACFLIRTDIFRSVGWFDEKYFFCPEDIALSTKLNNSGYECYVNADYTITHIGGGTRTVSKTSLATKPAQTRGLILFYGENSKLNGILARLIAIAFHGIRFLILSALCVVRFRRFELSRDAHKNGLCAAFSDRTPKQLFTKYYKSAR